MGSQQEEEEVRGAVPGEEGLVVFPSCIIWVAQMGKPLHYIHFEIPR